MLRMPCCPIRSTRQSGSQPRRYEKVTEMDFRDASESMNSHVVLLLCSSSLTPTQLPPPLPPTELTMYMYMNMYMYMYTYTYVYTYVYTYM